MDNRVQVYNLHLSTIFESMDNRVQVYNLHLSTIFEGSIHLLVILWQTELVITNTQLHVV